MLKKKKILFFLFFLQHSTSVQSVFGRNKSMCGSSHMLCYECMQFCAIHNSFALYGGGIIRDCCTKKAECQLTQILINLIAQNRC